MQEWWNEPETDNPDMIEVLLAEGPPAPPSEKRCLTFDLLLHIMEVVDSLQEPREGSSSDDNFAPPRRRTHNTFLGRIDGTGPGPALGGGHRFTGPGSGSVGVFSGSCSACPFCLRPLYSPPLGRRWCQLAHLDAFRREFLCWRLRLHPQLSQRLRS
ncbi:Os09g0545150 [Oryza sativa Japonica Group]|jgi:hypothetical protein|uniref:Os09g0545150 protein n=1 Tax=Oryza sativa subsp. japonica TaxID=39947 RepID=A0A0P0XQH6_ORYSJ|nr:Os09g0545150 [Oryza sativa Japonica Group]